MRIAIINPNTTASMTEKAAATARALAGPGTEIIASNPKTGPAAIEGAYDGALAVPGLLEELIRAEGEGADAGVIACFDDTGLAAAREALAMPVVGIGEAAFHVASLLVQRFSVVTTLAISVPIIEANLLAYGLNRRCGRVRASDIPVLALEDPASGAFERIGAEIEAAKREDRAEAIVLGCAGMTDLARALGERHGLPVIDGVASAVVLAEGLLRILRVGRPLRPGRACSSSD